MHYKPIFLSITSNLFLKFINSISYIIKNKVPAIGEREYAEYINLLKTEGEKSCPPKEATLSSEREENEL